MLSRLKKVGNDKELRSPLRLERSWRLLLLPGQVLACGLRPEQHKKTAALSGGCWRFGSMFDYYENSFCTMFPLRTNVIGRPVLVSYSIVGSMPKL